MIRRLLAEKGVLEQRIEFINAVVSKHNLSAQQPPYGCQEFSVDHLCRYDRRAVDRKCEGCERVTDKVELQRMGLWVEGVSHRSEGEANAAMD